jgi:hypothetical protein
VLETRGSPQSRWRWKLRLVKGLYERGLSREQVRQLSRVLDWMLALPPEVNESFREEIHRFEEARKMPYVTTIERLAKEEGRQEGVVDGFQNAIVELLKSKFAGAGAKYARKIRAERNIERLQAILVAVGRAETLDDVRGLLP